jgi:Flp pilus assembly protein TadG
MKQLHDEEGQVLVLTALMLVVLLGFMALAIDVGRLLLVKRQLQTMADAAAIAAALETGACGSMSNCVAMQDAAKSAATENGATGFTFLTQCAGSSGANLTVTLNNGPCALGASDPNHNDARFTEVVTSQQEPTLFAPIIGVNAVTVSARAEAGLGPPNFCVTILNGSASNALLMNGNASLIAQCGIMDDSDSGTALLVNGHDTLQATKINVTGQILENGNVSVTPKPSTGVPAMPDPLASTPIPSTGGCGTSSNNGPYNGSQTQVVVNSNKTASFNPGTYCGGITLNGGATATFSPGLYIVNGSMIVNGHASVSGSGVTFYFPTGSLTMNGAAHADFTAPTTGTYAGLLFFQNKSDTSTMIVNGDSTSVWQGAVYLPSAQLILNGGSNLAVYTILVVNTLTVNGNDQFNIGNDYSSLPGGAPVQGTSAYLME